MSLMRPFAVLVLLLTTLTPAVAADPPVFAQRGYYFTLTRMPTYGLDAWKDIFDCVREDGGNTVILWMGGGFRSKQFPDTWAHNRDHANVKHDFVKELIDHAHTKQVKVLLGFTPFGYDGVNRMSLTRPGWRATGPDGKPTAPFGFHSWGYNLCPANADARRFMLDYAREMVFDFYPNADGLFVEASDYAACHCRECGAKYFDREFAFVKAISGEVWQKNRDATVVVYPHYFTGAKVPVLGVTAAKQPFDPRWSLCYTPHSAAPDAALTRAAKGSIWSDDAVARHTPTTIRDAVRRAKREGCSGYVPSLEVFTYVPTEPEEGQSWLVGRRQLPYGFGWLQADRVPYRELPVRVNRIAYREYTRDPDLSDADFRATLGKELFGANATPEAVADALALQAAFAADRTWCQPAPAVSPDRVKAMAAANQLPDRKRAEYRAAVARLREIEQRYRDRPAFAELHRIAKWAADQWAGGNARLLDP